MKTAAEFEKEFDRLVNDTLFSSKATDQQIQEAIISFLKFIQIDALRTAQGMISYDYIATERIQKLIESIQSDQK